MCIVDVDGPVRRGECLIAGSQQASPGQSTGLREQPSYWNRSIRFGGLWKMGAFKTVVSLSATVIFHWTMNSLDLDVSTALSWLKPSCNCLHFA